MWLARKHLWRRRFDLAIVPRWDTDSYHAVFVAYFSGALRRIGYSQWVRKQKSRANKDYDKLLTEIIDDRTPKHEVERSLDLVRHLGGKIVDENVELWLTAEDTSFADRTLKGHGVNGRDLLVAFGVGSGWADKIWPVQNFVDVGRWLRSQYRARILVVGGGPEATSGQMLNEQLGNAVLNCAGQTTLRQTAALLKRCAIYIGNDTGVMHLAAAAGVSVVKISCHPKNGSPMHPRSPARFRPWGVESVVLQPSVPRPPCTDACSASGAHCICNVTVESVKSAASVLLAHKSEPNRKPSDIPCTVLD